jgi:hypothetical protein
MSFMDFAHATSGEVLAPRWPCSAILGLPGSSACIDLSLIESAVFELTNMPLFTAAERQIYNATACCTLY